MVKTICYGEVRTFEDRQDAIAFFREGIDCSDGSERERYTNILLDLLDGKDVCTDERE